MYIYICIYIHIYVYIYIYGYICDKFMDYPMGQAHGPGPWARTKGPKMAPGPWVLAQGQGPGRGPGPGSWPWPWARVPSRHLWAMDGMPPGPREAMVAVGTELDVEGQRLKWTDRA